MMTTTPNSRIERLDRSYKRARAALQQALALRNMPRALRAAKLMQALQMRMDDAARPAHAF